MTDQPKTHPSYGSARFSRVTGQRNLFGSAVKHQSWIELEILEAEMIGDIATRNHKVQPNNTQGIVRVALTNAQFAELISTRDTFAGTPCTITRVRDGKLKPVEDCPPAPSLDENIDAIINKAVDDAMATVRRDVKSVLEDLEGRLPKKLGASVTSRLQDLYTRIPSNIKFAGTLMQEAKDHLVGRAKVEIEARGEEFLRRQGLLAHAEAQKVLSAHGELQKLEAHDEEPEG